MRCFKRLPEKNARQPTLSKKITGGSESSWLWRLKESRVLMKQLPIRKLSLLKMKLSSLRRPTFKVSCREPQATSLALKIGASIQTIGLFSSYRTCETKRPRQKAGESRMRLLRSILMISNSASPYTSLTKVTRLTPKWLSS